MAYTENGIPDAGGDVCVDEQAGTIHPHSAEMREASAQPSLPSGLACLLNIARCHGIAADGGQLLHEFGGADKSFDDKAILHAARKLGLFAKQQRVTASRLQKFPAPSIASDHEGNFFVILRTDNSSGSDDGSAPDGRVMIIGSEAPAPCWITMADFRARWNGWLILFASRASMAIETQRFDFTWFIPAVVKYRKLLLEVLLVSVALQLFGLVTPLFFQVVMDKVLVHRGFSTLDVIAIGLLVVSLFEVLLNALRTYVFSHTCSRIDVELGAKLFGHLLSLPLPWFHARRAGDSVARLRELENIRSFLTGNGIALVLDLVFSVIFIGVMLLYSTTLTLIVVLSLPCYLALSIAVTPMMRRRLEEKFQRGAENQAFLVETVNSIDTVKAMAVEPSWKRKWENQLAAYLQAAFRAGNVGNWASNLVSLIGKLVTVATLWLGARLVIDGELTVGQLVAFNMLAGHVASPVMRLAQMWSDFQQVGVSVQRLGPASDTWPYRFRSSVFSLSTGWQGNAVRYSFEHQAGRGHRHRRPIRFGQKHAHKTAAATDAACQRTHSCRWHGYRVRRSGIAAPADRRRPAGKPAVQRHREGEHRAG